MSDSVGFYNNSGEAIPPYAVMEVEEVEIVGGRSLVKVRKPTGSDNEAGYLLNGPVTVPIGKTGNGYTATEPAWAYYDTGGTPSNGSEWGPEEDEWWLKSDQTGFRIVGGADATNERVLVRVIGGGGAVRVIGPCGTYTPDMADPDTDFETAYPGGCEGPDVLGLNLLNVITNTVQMIRLELESTGPLKLSSSSFNLTCESTTISCYFEVVFNDLDTGGVVGTIYKVSDDSVMQGYTNSLYAWNPLAGGNIQLGPNAAAQACECRTLPYDLCLSIPTR